MKMVKIGSVIMDAKKGEKIQIFPSKHQHHNSYNNKVMPKLTKTIMSPLTTMPAKNLMMAPNGMPSKSLASLKMTTSPTMMTAHEHRMPLCSVTKSNNEQKMTTPQKTNVVNAIEKNMIPSSMNDKLPQSIENSCKENLKEKSKGTAGYTSEREKILLGDVHPYITCYLCKGYLIEATTIVECLHTYCHSCLMKYLCREKSCPQCEMSINKSKTNIKYDATIQSMVYKLVPGLYEKELLRRRAFYKQRPDEAKNATPEERGDDTEHLIFSPSDLISLSLDYAEKETLKGMEEDPHVKNLMKPRFLNCPAIFKVEYLKKFIMNKFLINSNKFNVEISYKVKTIALPEHYTLMDVAYIYTWKKEAPMPFFFRIIAKNSKCNELPEVSLRRSPTAALTNINDDSISASKKKNVSFKEDVEMFGIKAEKDTRLSSSEGMGKVFNENLSSDFKKAQESSPRVESIKLKFDVSNNNVSIIKSHSTPKIDFKSSTKQQRLSEKKEKKGKLINYDFEQKLSKDKKDEYEFDDDIEKEKLGFLNTFQLTAKKMLMPKYSSTQNKMLTKTTTNVVEEGKNPSKSVENKRKNKEPVKNEKTKKYKFHEMKSVKEGNKFLFTKTGDGHEITFDMSPKPLGSKPPLSKVKSDILMAQQRADAKAIQSKVDMSVVSLEKNHASKAVQQKPKKLPLLLPKQAPSPVQNYPSTSLANAAMSPIAFVIKKPDLGKADPEISSNSEISVTKINDVHSRYRVYGPKSSDSISKDNVIKSPDVFAQPLPPKQKPNIFPFSPPTTIMPSTPSFLKPTKQLKHIHDNMQTPNGNRTPFYVPSSPSYIPNFDPKPQFKYANPNAYASFMQSMFNPQPTPQAGRTSPPINSVSSPKNSDNLRKRSSNDSSSNSVPTKRKSPSPTKSAETESKAISILNKINFPSSLSVTLTNEQEENKKEQLRSQKQSVNNNIEIIKISEEKDSKTKSPSSPKSGTNSVSSEKEVSEKKIPELKSLSPPPMTASSPLSMPPPAIPPPSIVKALSDSKESFQRAFLESIMNVSNRIDKNTEKNRKKSSSPDSIHSKSKTSSYNDSESNVKEGISESKNLNSGKRNLSLTPPLSKNVDKSNITIALKPLSPPPQISLQDHSMFSPAVAASSAMQFNLMLNALNAAAVTGSPHFGSFPDYANIQRNILLETLRKNVEKSSALLAMHHQMQQQQQQNQKNSPNSPSSSKH